MRGSASVYCDRARAKMEILGKLNVREFDKLFQSVIVGMELFDFQLMRGSKVKGISRL